MTIIKLLFHCFIYFILSATELFESIGNVNLTLSLKSYFEFIHIANKLHNKFALII